MNSRRNKIPGEYVSTRKFHDFIFFVIFAVGFCISMLTFFCSAKFHPISDQFNMWNPRYMFSTICVPILLFFCSTILLKYFTAPVIHISSIVSILYCLYVCLKAKDILTMILSGVYLLGMCFMYLIICYKINRIKVAISYAAGFIITHFLEFTTISLLTFIACCSFLFTFLIIVAANSRQLIDVSNDTQLTFMRVIFLLQLFWTMFNCYYLHTFYTANFVSEVITAQKKGFRAFGGALSNTFRGIGTICLAGLLSAFVNLISLLINERRDDSRRRRGLLESIVIKVISLLLEVIVDIVESINRWSMVYSAINGTSYKTSVIKSVGAMLNVNNNIFIIFRAVGLIISCFALFYISIMSSLNKYFGIFKLSNREMSDIYSNLACILPPMVLGALLLQNIYFTLLSTAYIYINGSMSCVERSFPGICEAFSA